MRYVLPAEFTRLESYSSIAYQSAETGELDVVRFVNGYVDPWVSPIPARQIKNKKLVLSDWRAPYWDDETVDALCAVLEWLMTPSLSGLEEGFEIYVGQPGKLELLEREQLQDLSRASFRKLITGDDSSVIKQAAYDQYGFAVDDIELIDDYVVDQLLGEDVESSDYQLSLHYWLKIDSADVRTGILKGVTSRKQDEFGHVVIDEFSAQANPCAEIMSEAPDFFKPIISYRYLTLDSFLLMRLLESVPITLAKRSLELGELANLRELNIIFNKTSSAVFDLQTTLKSFPKLRKLQLDKSGDLALGFPKMTLNEAELGRLESLREIDSAVKIDNESLDVLFRLSPNLQKISLFECGVFPSGITEKLPHLKKLSLKASSIGFDKLFPILLEKKLTQLELIDYRGGSLELLDSLEPGSLKRLEVVKFTGKEVKLSASTVSKLIKAAPNLREIVLAECDLSGNGLEVLAAKSLSKLEEFSLENSSISIKNLLALLKAAPNLMKITLAGCPLSRDVLESLRPGSLNKLKEFNLKTGFISASSVLALLKAAPNLEKISLPECDLSENVLEALDAKSLAELKEFSLESGSISAKNLLALLKAAPNLTKITLAGCNLSTGAFESLRPGSLNELKEFELKEGVVSASDLLSLLKAAPNLEKISLPGCNLSTISLEGFEPVSLAKLKSFKLDYGKISASNLARFVKLAPSLERIIFLFSDFLTSTFNEIELGRFNNIEDIQFWGSHNLTSKDLVLFLNACPKLKFLTLYGCDNLLGSFTGLLPERINNLVLLNLRESKINPQNLKLLLRACPELRKLELGSEYSYYGHDAELDSMLNRLKEAGIYKDPPLALVGAEAGAVPATTVVHEPVHDAQSHKNLEPTNEESYRFSYKGSNNTKNQAMLIEQFSQYCTLTGRHTALIAKIQDGICRPLADYFLKQGGRLDILEAVSRWDGTLATLDEKFEGHAKSLREYFEELPSIINEPALLIPPKYLGDNLEAFCASHNKACVLDNPWHRVAIYPKPDTDDWIFYNPNSPQGPRELKRAELAEALHRALGGCISVTTADETLKPKIDDPGQFIRRGGLFSLSKASADELGIMLTSLGSVSALSPYELEGILLRNVHGFPAWAAAFMKTETQECASQLLAEFIQKSPGTYIYELRTSLAVTPPLKKQELISKIITYKNTLTASAAVHLGKVLEAIAPNVLLRRKRVKIVLLNLILLKMCRPSVLSYIITVRVAIIDPFFMLIHPVI